MTAWQYLLPHVEDISNRILECGFQGIRIRVNGEIVVSHAPASKMPGVLRALAFAMEAHPNPELVQVIAVRAGVEGAIEEAITSAAGGRE